MMKSVLFVVVFAVLAACVASQSQTNPWLGADLYINPDYVKEVESTITKYPDLADKLKKVEAVSAAYWIDTIARINNITEVLNGAKAQHAKTGKKTLVCFIIYDLPNRDCSAAASNGEIHCADSACTEGLNTYKTKYVDPIIAIFKKYPELQIVAIVEPDSLGNLATNLNVPKCQQAQSAYLTGIAYSISQLAAIKNVAIYLDAAHGGWLGWDNNRNAIAQIFVKVLQSAGGFNTIRGFATNVANYQPLGSITDQSDPCKLSSQYNNATNEVKYVDMLSKTLAGVGITGKGYIIDTGRNGVTNMRSDCSNWCNINNSGLGIRPTTDTKSSGLDIIDAYYWLKTPGESDGTSDTSAQRYDFHCGSVDSFKPSPEAGQWNAPFFAMLVKNAKPAL